MNRVLGIRAEPNHVFWAVVEGTAQSPIQLAADKAAAPISYQEEAASLTWYRTHISQILEQFVPKIVAIRFPEPFGRSSTDSTRRRCRIEGVLMETASSRGLPVHTAALVTITKNLGCKSAKEDLEKETLRGIDWSKHPKNLREAIIIAVSILGN